MATENHQPSSFGAKLGAWGRLAWIEIKRDLLLIFLGLRNAKIKTLDRTRAYHQLGKKCHEEGIVPEKVAALRTGILQIEQRLEARQQEKIPLDETATFAAKAKALISEGIRKMQIMILALRRHGQFCRFGRGLASNAESDLPEEELSRVHALRRQLDDLGQRRREVQTWGFRPKGRWVAAGGVVVAMLWLGAIGVGILAFTRPRPPSYLVQKSAPAAHSKDVLPSAVVPPPAPTADAKEAQEWLDKGAKFHAAGDMVQAFDSFMRSAELGDLRAQLQVGWGYENDAGVAQDYWKAARWYRKAAEGGNATAMKNLGQLYENGRGVPEDWVMAAQWYRKGAEKMDNSAESALGRAYQFGIGVPQDRQVSIYWNERAFAHGDAECERWVRWLRDPTNNIGFRNEGEQSLVIGNQLRTSGLLLGADPAGILFHNSEERIQWLRGLRNAVDKDEAENRHRMAEFERQQTESSRRRHGDEVQRLIGQGYSREAAEGKAGW